MHGVPEAFAAACWASIDQEHGIIIDKLLKALFTGGIVVGAADAEGERGGLTWEGVQRDEEQAGRPPR